MGEDPAGDPSPWDAWAWSFLGMIGVERKFDRRRRRTEYSVDPVRFGAFTMGCTAAWFLMRPRNKRGDQGQDFATPRVVCDLPLSEFLKLLRQNVVQSVTYVADGRRGNRLDYVLQPGQTLAVKEATGNRTVAVYTRTISLSNKFYT